MLNELDNARRLYTDLVETDDLDTLIENMLALKQQPLRAIVLERVLAERSRPKP